MALAKMADTMKSETGFYPGYEEVRMARAVASLVVMEAVANGESHGLFRGFRIDATRLRCGHTDAYVMRVELVVRLEGLLFDCAIAEILPLHFD